VSALLRLLLFVPIVYLVMVVYGGQHETDAAGVLRAAARKTVKVVFWVVVAVLVMELIEYLALP